MEKSATIVVTGAAGFIGSCLVEFLNEKGFNNIIAVDDFTREDRAPNLEGKRYKEKIGREDFIEWVSVYKGPIDFIFHLGARTDTLELDYSIHHYYNVHYSKRVWEYCTTNQVPLVYASSAATYGTGELGYDDSHEIIGKLCPLNAYGVSKNEFDKWVLQQTGHPPFWIGLKFFNVYGPNEYHKGRMASMIWHSFNQIRNDGVVKLFRSHRPNFNDGEQLRDFVYVKDILKVCYWLMNDYYYPFRDQLATIPGERVINGIYNLGTGKARTFDDLVRFVFDKIGKPTKIKYIDIPEHVRENYQYFTEANINKLKRAGYQNGFYSLEAGIDDYVGNYLIKGEYY